MSEAAAVAKAGHNKPPVTPPADTDMLEDLQRRYPEMDAKLAEFDASLKTFPDKLKLSEPEVAETLQDVLGQIKKHKAAIAGHKKAEKKPWDGIVKIVQNFFVKNDEAVAALLEKWEPVYEDYLAQKAADATRKANEEAERQRQAAEASRLAAEAEEKRRAEAEERRIAEEKREQEAREQAELQEKRRKESEAAAKAAAEEEKRLAAERKERDRKERYRNSESLKLIRRHMKDAEKLQAAAVEAGDETTDEDVKLLDSLVRHGGTVSLLAGPVANSDLLDGDERIEIEDVRQRLDELRAAVAERMTAKERRTREAARKAAEKEEARLAEERRVTREADEKRAADAKAVREAAEKEADDAKAARDAAKGEASDALKGQNKASTEIREATKAGRQHDEVADRAENRATRIEDKLGKSTEADLSRTRGDLGTVGGLTRRWKHYMPENESGLRSGCGVLGPHLTSEALNGAVFHYMRAHQSGFEGERVEPAELPGVVFAYELDSVIRT